LERGIWAEKRLRGAKEPLGSLTKQGNAKEKM